MSSEQLSNTETINKQTDSTEVDGGKALKQEIINEQNKKDENKNNNTSTFSQFTSYVGDALSNMAKIIPDTIDKINQDPKAKRNFIRGLNIIAESSGYDKEFKSPIGKVATGILKAEKEFTAEELARLKAEMQQRRYASPKETGLTEVFKKYMTDYATREKGYQATDTRYTELFKLAKKGFDSPTGLIENFLTPIQKIASELGLGERYDKLVTEIKGKKPSELSDAQKVEFKDIFSAATQKSIVSQVKDLYPASDKDIQVLLSSVGDLKTNPQALAKLVAAEKAAKEIATVGNTLVQKIAFDENNLNFEQEAKERAAVSLAKNFNNKVSDRTLEEMYGSTERTPFRVINAYYYKELSPKYKDVLDPFTQYKENQIKKNQQIKDIITSEQDKILK